MDILRIILIVLGIAFIVGIYLWDKYQRNDLPDRISSNDFKGSDDEGLVITTNTKYNEEDLASELSDLNFFMGDRPGSGSADSEELNDFSISHSSEIEPDVNHDEQMFPSDEIESQPVPPTKHIIALHIAAAEGKEFSGIQIQNVIEGLGFEFGEMNIFHYQDIDLSGNMQTLFSLVNMYEPGHFDIKNMEKFSTRGISVFATLKNDGTDAHIFDTMKQITEELAKQLNAEILGVDKSPLTEEAVKKIYRKLREAE